MEKTNSSESEANNNVVLAEVKKVICRLTDASENEIKEMTNLSVDLKMTSQQLKSLATSFSKIAMQYKSSAVIGMDECTKLTTIKSCVDAIMEKIK